MLPTDQLAVPPGYSTNIIMFYTQNKKQLCWLLFSKFVVQKCANINRIVLARNGQVDHSLWLLTCERPEVGLGTTHRLKSVIHLKMTPFRAIYLIWTVLNKQVLAHKHNVVIVSVPISTHRLSTFCFQKTEHQKHRQNHTWRFDFSLQFYSRLKM